MIAALGLGELLWSLLVFYLIVQYLIIVFVVIMDLFRSNDLSGGKKLLWALALLFFPIITLIAYLLTRGDGIGVRNMAAAERDRVVLPAPPPPPAPAAPASELQTAKALRDDGTITDAEFEAIKARILAG